MEHLKFDEFSTQAVNLTLSIASLTQGTKELSTQSSPSTSPISSSSSSSPSTLSSSFGTSTATVASSSDFDSGLSLPPLQAIIISIILLVVIFVTAVGNILVCIAVCMVRKLRRPCNYLLVSLAVSDLCVAILVSLSNKHFNEKKVKQKNPLICHTMNSFNFAVFEMGVNFSVFFYLQ